MEYKLVLFTNTKVHTGFWSYQNRWLWVTLNGPVAVITRYFTQYWSFRNQLQLDPLLSATKM